MGVFRVVGGVVVVGVEAWAGTGGGESEGEREQEFAGGGLGEPGEPAEDGLGQPGENGAAATLVGEFNGTRCNEKDGAGVGDAGQVEINGYLCDVGAFEGEVIERGLEFLGGEEVFGLVGNARFVLRIELDFRTNEFGVGNDWVGRCPARGGS